MKTHKNIRLSFAFAIGIFFSGYSIKDLNAQIYYFYDMDGNRVQQGTIDYLAINNNHHKQNYDAEINDSIGIYPNPVNISASIKILTNHSDCLARIDIYDLRGYCILSMPSVTIPSPVTINMSNYAEGTYIVKATFCGEQLAATLYKINSKISPATNFTPKLIAK